MLENKLGVLEYELDPDLAQWEIVSDLEWAVGSGPVSERGKSTP